MKPIILNLLAEEQLAEQASARDPVKTIVLLASCLLLVVGVAGVYVGWHASSKEMEAAALKKRHEALTAQVAEGSGDLRTWRLLANDLIAINNARPLFAWQMAWIKDVLPESIQLRSIVIAADGMGAAVESKKSARVAGSERVLLRLEGQVTCARPEIEIDEFIKTMRNYPSMKESMERVQLRSIARATSPGPDQMPSAQFVIECAYRGQLQ